MRFVTGAYRTLSDCIHVEDVPVLRGQVAVGGREAQNGTMKRHTAPDDSPTSNRGQGHAATDRVVPCAVPVKDPPRLSRPLMLSRVAAGFPSPADDYIDRSLDLNDHIVKHPAATFYVRASGESMLGAGVHDGDLLVVDRALDPRPGRVVIAAVDGELTVKRLVREGGRLLLAPENAAYPPLDITGREDVEVWGVVTHVVHAL